MEKALKIKYNDWGQIGGNPGEVRGAGDFVVFYETKEDAEAASSGIFSKLDSWMFKREKRYAHHRYPCKNLQWKILKYWDNLNLEIEDKGVFGNKESGVYLLKFSWFPIERHALVTGQHSHDNSALREYGRERTKEEIKKSKAQDTEGRDKAKPKMPYSRGIPIEQGEPARAPHNTTRQGENDDVNNLMIVHLRCHNKYTKNSSVGLA